MVRVEAFRAVPVPLRFENHSRRTSILGLPTVSELSRSKNLSMREAALVIAIDRVAILCRERGWV